MYEDIFVTAGKLWQPCNKVYTYYKPLVTAPQQHRGRHMYMQTQKSLHTESFY